MMENVSDILLHTVLPSECTHTKDNADETTKRTTMKSKTRFELTEADFNPTNWRRLTSIAPSEQSCHTIVHHTESINSVSRCTIIRV